MLLIPFVENAFKHGNIIEGSLKVEINIKVLENRLNFMVRNTSVNNESQKENHGIGLENIKKRLELNYTNNYKLDIYSSGQWYNTSLAIFNLNTTNIA